MCMSFVIAENEATNNSLVTLSGPPFATVNDTVEFKLNSVLMVISHPHSVYICMCLIIKYSHVYRFSDLK